MVLSLEIRLLTFQTPHRDLHVLQNELFTRTKQKKSFGITFNSNSLIHPSLIRNFVRKTWLFFLKCIKSYLRYSERTSSRQSLTTASRVSSVSDARTQVSSITFSYSKQCCEKLINVNLEWKDTKRGLDCEWAHVSCVLFFSFFRTFPLWIRCQWLRVKKRTGVRVVTIHIQTTHLI